VIEGGDVAFFCEAYLNFRFHGDLEIPEAAEPILDSFGLIFRINLFLFLSFRQRSRISIVSLYRIGEIGLEDPVKNND
jgi:hypothetical protein